MNFVSSIFCLVKILGFITVARSDFWRGDAIEKFYWTPKIDGRIKWEFLIIGKRVTWHVGKVLCSSKNSFSGLTNEKSIEDTWRLKNSTISRRDEDNEDSSVLALLENDETRVWLARMLSESNYRYDGLWIGGHRKDSASNWTWMKSEEEEEIPIVSTILSDYPEWYKNIDATHENSRNCLTFDRMGHNLPVLVPADCQLKKSFLCSRIVQKKNPEIIVEGTSVTVDGGRYTIFGVDENEEPDVEDNSGARKLNGGGVKWIDARLECRKRGKYLAAVMSNEAAKKIASIMMKNRPSMESAWLGARSTDGIEWTWSTTGSVLASKPSSTSKYPPWLKGHPISGSGNAEYNQRNGRCLILDRHLCPDHYSPVFLDLDCEKKRPFVCQDDIPGRYLDEDNNGGSLDRRIRSGDRILEFSGDRMTWNEGRDYCAKNHGEIASILDSKTLSNVLNKMGDTYLDHVWVGGKTVKTNEGWKWFDETGRALTRKSIGMEVSWCLEDDKSGLPKAEPHNCLNLDREPHGLPLFYGLGCNFTKQHVLCSLDNTAQTLGVNGHRSLHPVTKNDTKNQDGGKSFSTTINHGEFHADDSFEIDATNTTVSHYVPGKNDSINGTMESRFLREGIGLNATKGSDKKNETEKGTRVADLDQETKDLLIASGYNISDSDLILGLELEVVDLQETSTSNAITNNPEA